MKGRKRKGQVMVEAAIGIALFLMLTLGAIETARFALRRMQVTYASFQADRVAIVNKGDTTAVRRTLEVISSHIKDAKFELKDEGEEYSLIIKKTFHPLIPFIDVDSLSFVGYARLPKGHFQNKEFPYKYKGYSSYYPDVFNTSDMEDPDRAGILTYDRYIRAFIRCEDNPYEEWNPGAKKYGGGGEAEIVRGGKDERNDPFHLGSWYPPFGILRNPGPEKDRTGNQARIDQYYFIEAMLMGPSAFPFLWFIPERKPYWSRAITGFGHGNNLQTGKDAHPYYGDIQEFIQTRMLATFGWWGLWPRFESMIWPIGADGIVTGFYDVGWGGRWGSFDPWGAKYYKNTTNFITGWGNAVGEACWTDPWTGTSFGQKGWGVTNFIGWNANYLGDKSSYRSYWRRSNWRSWKGNRRLYDAAFYVATFNELEYIYLIEGFITENHGSSTPMKDDLRGFGGPWNCMTLKHKDEWNGGERR
jgi:hypothetical protein